MIYQICLILCISILAELFHGICPVASQIRVKLLLEVDLFVRLIWHDCRLAWLPVGRAHLAVLVGELEGLDQTECLIHRSADGIIIDLH